MSTDDYLAFLEAHQPMPGDWTITDEEGDIFAAALKHFEANPDPRCLRLFINAVSKDTGLGMYEHIKFVLLAHPTEIVVPHLERGLRWERPGVAYRCCWWSADVGAWELASLVRLLLTHSDEDVRDAASAFLEMAEEGGHRRGSDPV